MAVKYANFIDPFMDLSKRLGVIISNLMKTIKEFGFSQNANEACVYEKVSGSAIVFLDYMWMTY